MRGLSRNDIPTRLRNHRRKPPTERYMPRYAERHATLYNSLIFMEGNKWLGNLDSNQD